MRTIPSTVAFAPLVAIMFLPLYSTVVAAEPPIGSERSVAAQIDRAVAKFTGHQIGEEGGARNPADPRLRLATCDRDLVTAWYGRAKSTVEVSCPSANGWRIFVALNAPAATEKAKPAVRRGDPVTVVVRGRGFTVQRAGEALEGGTTGDWIDIRTARDATPVRARIERTGFAVIPSN